METYDIFNLIVNSDYKLTQTDFLLMTQKYYYIKDYKKYNLVLDDYIIQTCQNLLFFPYEEIQPTKIAVLEMLKKKQSIKFLEKIIKKYNIIPDYDFIVIYMDYNCNFESRITAEYIQRKYLQFDLKTICDYYNPIGEIDHYFEILRKVYNLKIFDFNEFYNEKHIQNFLNYLLDDNLKLFHKKLKKYTKNTNTISIEDAFFGYEQFIEKNHVNFDIKLIKLLYHHSIEECSATQKDNILKFIEYIVKKYDIKFDFEIIVMLHNYHFDVLSIFPINI